MSCHVGSTLQIQFSAGCHAAYLSGRTQTVVYNEQQTDIIEIDCSVPQGSALGPVKFAAYTEDIVDVVDRHQTRLHLYADDTQLYDSC